jgi:hypothetical protein
VAKEGSSSWRIEAHQIYLNSYVHNYTKKFKKKESLEDAKEPSGKNQNIHSAFPVLFSG